MAVDQYVGHKSLTGHRELTHLRKSRRRKESFYKKNKVYNELSKSQFFKANCSYLRFRLTIQRTEKKKSRYRKENWSGGLHSQDPLGTHAQADGPLP